MIESPSVHCPGQKSVLYIIFALILQTHTFLISIHSFGVKMFVLLGGGGGRGRGGCDKPLEVLGAQIIHFLIDTQKNRSSTTNPAIQIVKFMRVPAELFIVNIHMYKMTY